MVSPPAPHLLNSHCRGGQVLDRIPQDPRQVAAAAGRQRLEADLDVGLAAPRKAHLQPHLVQLVLVDTVHTDVGNIGGLCAQLEPGG